MTDKEKEEAISKALLDPKILSKLGEAMAAPIKHALSVSSVMRGAVEMIPLEVLTAAEQEEERIANKLW